MKKNYRWIAAILALSMCVAGGNVAFAAEASTKSSASSTKKVLSPSGVNKRIDKGFKAFFEDIDNSTYTTRFEDDLNYLEAWDSIFEWAYEDTGVVLSQIQEAKDRGNDSYTSKGGNQVETKKTDDAYYFKMTGAMDFGTKDSEDLRLTRKEITFNRKTGNISQEMYLLNENDKKGQNIRYMDISVNGKNTFIQILDYDPSEKESGKPYWAIRVMVADGKLAGSVTMLSTSKAKEALFNNKTFTNFDDFAYPVGNRLIYTGSTISGRLTSGTNIEYKQVAGSNVNEDKIKVE